MILLKRELRQRGGLKCVFCGTVYSTARGLYLPAVRHRGDLDVEFDYAAIGRRLTRRPAGGALRPVALEIPRAAAHRRGCALPALAVGWTPLTPAATLARHLVCARSG